MGPEAPGDDPARRGARRRAKLGLALAGFAVAALIAEGLMALLGVHFQASLFTPDPDRGWALRAGARGFTRGEGGVLVRVSSAGLRDREHTLAKPAGTYRIAVLGDSFAAALGVEPEQAFWSLLEGKLTECGAFAGRKVEVLNFGVSGYGTAQELITLQKHVWRYSPDLVLLAFYPGNDVLNNERTLNPNNAQEAPYFVFRGGELVLDDRFRETVWTDPRAVGLRNAYADVMNRSEILLALSAARRTVASRRAAPATPSAEARLLPFAPPAEPAMHAAWRVTEALLVRMRDEVAARGAEFRIVTLSAPEQVDPRAANRDACERRLGVRDLFYQEDRLQALAKAEHMRLLALAPALAQRADERQEFFHSEERLLGEGHYNRLGHAAVAELIARDYCAPQPDPRP